jgi:hypothetical protein
MLGPRSGLIGFGVARLERWDMCCHAAGEGEANCCRSSTRQSGNSFGCHLPRGFGRLPPAESALDCQSGQGHLQRHHDTLDALRELGPNGRGLFNRR